MSINLTTAYKTKIDIPFGQLKDIVKWCEDNLVGDWKFSEDHNYPYHPYNNYIFLFELERDYVAFHIWKK